ncbi:hypothetical protein J2848_001373 [Azospirillum lipoferum]|uniref:Uncharacterized protein n=1 Tax=Azospirillum lipoferum TaxID=193 RepID=A0A5A9GUX6_AZOLI|nr:MULTISPECIES: hypothetical protein [Azospirillum]KAA0598291.1 hypothetical protein FZ942_04180 [Azospirillum lipoferum]MCP1609726.1 hypothetical protein [Azospirillum lipoferum]MDW5534969.1 hypothetical protein [Azospirillum sp. NL1]
MSNSYVDGKVREAILAAKGSRMNAQKILMAWAVEDPELLRGIAQPFLKAIAAAAIERAGRPPSSRSAARPAAAGGAGGGRPSASGLSRDALENLLNQLGREPDESVPQRPVPAGKTAAAGGAGAGKGATVHNAPAGGPNHEKAMMAIAKAFVAKKVR